MPVCTPAVSCGLAGPVQEVLGALHGHLGSGQAPEVTAALAVLLSLARTHSQELLQHVGFISNVLDCLPSFTQAQTHQVRCESTFVQLSCTARQHPDHPPFGCWLKPGMLPSAGLHSVSGHRAGFE